jgi:hypothetical protein
MKDQTPISTCKDGILIFKDAVSHDFCKRMIARFEKNNNDKDSTINLNKEDKLRDGETWIFPPDKELAGIIKLIVMEYKKQMDVVIPSVHPAINVSLAKYSQFDHCREHTDQGHHQLPRTQVLTMVILLNDNYEHGELYLSNQKIKVKEEGAAVCFPAGFQYPHEVIMVTGEKPRYSLIIPMYYAEVVKNTHVPNYGIVL